LSDSKFFNDPEGRAAFLRQLSFLLIPTSHALLLVGSSDP